MKIRPPGLADSWDSCNVTSKAKLLGYNRVRELEESKLLETINK